MGKVTLQLSKAKIFQRVNAVPEKHFSVSPKFPKRKGPQHIHIGHNINTDTVLKLTILQVPENQIIFHQKFEFVPPGSLLAANAVPVTKLLCLLQQLLQMLANSIIMKLQYLHFITLPPEHKELCLT